MYDGSILFQLWRTSSLQKILSPDRFSFFAHGCAGWGVRRGVRVCERSTRSKEEETSSLWFVFVSHKLFSLAHPADWLLTLRSVSPVGAGQRLKGTPQLLFLHHAYTGMPKDIDIGIYPLLASRCILHKRTKEDAGAERMNRIGSLLVLVQ